MLGWILLLLASSLGGQVTPAPKYRVVKTEKVEQKPSIAAVKCVGGSRVSAAGTETAVHPAV